MTLQIVSKGKFDGCVHVWRMHSVWDHEAPERDLVRHVLWYCMHCRQIEMEPLVSEKELAALLRRFDGEGG